MDFQRLFVVDDQNYGPEQECNLRARTLYRYESLERLEENAHAQCQEEDAVEEGTHSRGTVPAVG